MATTILPIPRFSAIQSSASSQPSDVVVNWLARHTPCLSYVAMVIARRPALRDPWGTALTAPIRNVIERLQSELIQKQSPSLKTSSARISEMAHFEDVWNVNGSKGDRHRGRSQSPWSRWLVGRSISRYFETSRYYSVPVADRLRSFPQSGSTRSLFQACQSPFNCKTFSGCWFARSFDSPRSLFRL